MENIDIKSSISKFLNNAFKLSLIFDLGGRGSVDKNQINEFLESKYKFINLISSCNDLDESICSLIKFISLAKIIPPEECNFSSFQKFEETKLSDVLLILDDLVNHKLKGKESYEFNQEVLSIVNRAQNFENSYKILLSSIKHINDDLCCTVFELINKFAVLLSDHPSHFVVSVKGDNSLPTSSELKDLIFDYQFAPNIHQEDLRILIDRYIKLIKGEGIISRIETIRANSQANPEFSSKHGLQ